MVDWVGAENTGIPHALALALRGTSMREIARKTGIAESSLSDKNMSASRAVDQHILDALGLALNRKSMHRRPGVEAQCRATARERRPTCYSWFIDNRSRG
jgi:hypothetical protein